uniref:IRF tryptophan pentad repeat domain-containing protein n=1 Tax=Tetraodon nigroviridis TaxID=99883 RepID=H3C9U7_TETNG
DEDAAIFKAWAAFKGKLSDGDQDNPACWKTRLRCALNKSPEFTEVLERAQLDISDPYKVYRLVPFSEQGMVVPDKKSRAKAAKRPKRRRSSQLAEDDSSQVKVKKREVTSPPVSPSSRLMEEVSMAAETVPEAQQRSEILILTEDAAQDVARDTKPASEPASGSTFKWPFCYLGQEVFKRRVQGVDIRILYLACSPLPRPRPAGIGGRFPRFWCPDPPTWWPAEHGSSKLWPSRQHGLWLTSWTQGFHGKRFCQGRFFGTGPHTTSPGPHKWEQNTEPGWFFIKDFFKQ